jgi:hypothetical protein
MTKQFQELFKQFSQLDNTAQLEEIRAIRHRRSIERPATARKRIVKEAKQKKGKTDKLRGMLAKLTPEQMAELKSKLAATKDESNDP